MSGDEPPYDLVVTPAARRALSETLPASAAFAAWEFISGPLAAEPHRVGAPLRQPFQGHYRARRGEYRVRYLVDDDRRVVSVLDVEHRRDVYRT